MEDFALHTSFNPTAGSGQAQRAYSEACLTQQKDLEP